MELYPVLTLKNEMELYPVLFELLGRPPTSSQLRLLYLIIENRRFSLPDLMGSVGSRSNFYAVLRFFEEKGLVERIPQPQLPEGAEEWSKNRRRKYKKEIGVTKRQYYRFTPRNMVKVIDKKIEQLEIRIEQLETMKAQLKSET